MKKSVFQRILCLLTASLMLVALVTGCGDQKKDGTILTDCTIKVQNNAGTGLEGVAVSVYSDKEKTDMLDYVRTGSDGVATLSTAVSSGSYIFLAELPEGYTAEEYYTLNKQNTVIKLTGNASLNISPITLGDTMFDFTVTDQNGDSYTLSELLSSKKAVVLNLWFTTCDPCKKEFPFLQQAYSEYADDIALLALNPIDNADAVAAFAANNGLSIPMVSCDTAWANIIENIAYPTTIVIDRFGKVSLIHTGSIDNSKTFKNMFAHFTAEDYQHETFDGMSKFEANADSQGSEANPFEHNGAGNFSVKVKANETIYYTLYGANEMEMTVKGDSLKLLCGDEEYTSADGKTALTIKATDASAPVTIQFTNTGSEETIYKVTLTAPKGSLDNPILIEGNSVTAELEADNSFGLFYQYKAPDEGIVTVEAKNDITYAAIVTNLASNKAAALDIDNKSVIIDVLKGNTVQIVVKAIAVDGVYPAAVAELNVTFTHRDDTTTVASSTTTVKSTSSATKDTTVTNGNQSSKTTTVTKATSTTAKTNTSATKESDNTTKKTTTTKTTTTGKSTSTTKSTAASQPVGPNTNGTLSNPNAPVEKYGEEALSFETEVKAGEMVLHHLYKISGTVLRLVDADAYVIYEGKTYTPDKNGVISLPVSSEGPTIPVELKVGNSGSSTKTFSLKFSFPEGSMMNPIKAKFGEMKTKIAAGNDQGVFYNFGFIEVDGELTITLKNVTPSIECDITVTTIYNDVPTTRTLAEMSEDGKTFVVEAYEEDRVEVVIATLPDENNQYPAATIEWEIIFTEI